MTDSIGKSFQSNDICICVAIFSMSIISSHRKELTSLTMCVKKNFGIPKCSTMQSKSCICVLCHRGVPSIFVGKLYLTIYLRIFSSLILGFFVLHFFMFLSTPVREVFFISFNDCHKSYIYNKYGLYNVKGENNAFIMYFKYSLKCVLPL